MATHSSSLAWRIPTDRGAWWAMYMGSQRVRHDWAITLSFMFQLSLERKFNLAYGTIKGAEMWGNHGRRDGMIRHRESFLPKGVLCPWNEVLRQKSNAACGYACSLPLEMLDLQQKHTSDFFQVTDLKIRAYGESFLHRSKIPRNEIWSILFKSETTNHLILIRTRGFPGGLEGKTSACDTGGQRQSLGREDPWRRVWQPTPVFLPGEFHGQRSPVGCIVHGAAKSQTRLSHQHYQNKDLNRASEERSGSTGRVRADKETSDRGAEGGDSV